jgi:hypothetical protein
MGIINRVILLGTGGDPGKGLRVKNLPPAQGRPPYFTGAWTTIQAGDTDSRSRGGRNPVSAHRCRAGIRFTVGHILNLLFHQFLFVGRLFNILPKNEKAPMIHLDAFVYLDLAAHHWTAKPNDSAKDFKRQKASFLGDAFVFPYATRLRVAST